VVRVERRHKLVFGEDWLRRSVRVNLPNRGPQRKVNRRITFTYAMRLAPLPDPTTTTTSTTTTTTTTTEAPVREGENALASSNHQIVTSSSSISYTPLSGILVADHSVGQVTHRPHTQYTPIDGIFLPQSSNAYPLPQSVFTQSTTTTTQSPAEKEYTLLENVYTPEQFVSISTTPTTIYKETTEEDRFTPVGTIPQPTQAAEMVHENYPIPQPPISSSLKPVKKIPQVQYNQLGGLVLPPNFPAHATPPQADYTPINGLFVSHRPGLLKTRPSTTEAPTTTTTTTTAEPEVHYTQLGNIYGVVSSTTEYPEISAEESHHVPIHNVFASFSDPSTGQYTPNGHFSSASQTNFIPYSYPTTFMTEEEPGTTQPTTTTDTTAKEVSSEEESEEAVPISIVESAIVERNENGTESSVYSTMPVVVESPRKNATATVILNSNNNDRSSEESDESTEKNDDNDSEMEALYDYAVYPNGGVF